MWPIQTRHRLGDEVIEVHWIGWIPGVPVDIDQGDAASITTQRGSTCDRQPLKQTTVGSRDCLTGPAKERVVDLPVLAAVKTPNQVPLMKEVPSPVSR